MTKALGAEIGGHGKKLEEHKKLMENPIRIIAEVIEVKKKYARRACLASDTGKTAKGSST